MAEYAMIDVGYYRDPKIAGLRIHQRELFMELILHAQEHGTDGYLSRNSLRACGKRTDSLSALVRAGLLEENGEGWRIRRFLKYQVPAAKLEARREKARKAAFARWEGDDARSNARSNAQSMPGEDARSNADA